jgi:hypothetical protein
MCPFILLLEQVTIFPIVKEIQEYWNTRYTFSKVFTEKMHVIKYCVILYYKF